MEERPEKNQASEDDWDESNDHQTSKYQIKSCIKGSDVEPKSYKNRIFVGGISIDLKEGKNSSLKNPPNFNLADIQAYFETFGLVTKIKLPRKEGHLNSRGYCFITFNDTETFDKVMSQKHIIGGKKVKLIVKFLNSNLDPG